VGAARVPPGCRTRVPHKGAARVLQGCCKGVLCRKGCKGAVQGCHTRPHREQWRRRSGARVCRKQVPCIKRRAEAERGAAIACVAALVNFRSQGLVIMRLQGELGPSSGFDWPVQRSSVDNVPPCTRRVLQVCTVAALQCTATDYRGGSSKGRASSQLTSI